MYVALWQTFCADIKYNDYVVFWTVKVLLEVGKVRRAPKFQKVGITIYLLQEAAGAISRDKGPGAIIVQDSLWKSQVFALDAMRTRHYSQCELCRASRDARDTERVSSDSLFV